MENGERVLQEEAMTMLGGMSTVDFLSILREEKVPAYRIHDGALVDVEELIEDRRHAVLRRRVWDSTEAKRMRERNVPGWNDPYSENFGKGVGRAMFRGTFGFQYSDVPALTPGMIDEILSTLFFMKADVKAYRDTMTPTEETPAAAQAFDHNEDFTSVTKDGVTFGPLTKTQAAIIKVLYEASKKTPSYLREETIRQKAAVILDQSGDDEHGKKIKDVFKKRNKAAFDALIERVRPGVYQLKG